MHEVHALGEFIGVIVMQIRNTASFLRAASILADIVQDRGTAHQGRIHLHLRVKQLRGDVYGHETDTGDMTECFKARDVAVKPHERIEVSFLQDFEKPEIGRAALIPLCLISVQKDQATGAVLSEKRFFPVKKFIQKIQIEQDRFPSFLAIRRLLSSGIELFEKPGTDIFVPAVPLPGAGVFTQLFQLLFRCAGYQRDISAFLPDGNGRSCRKDLFVSFFTVHGLPHINRQMVSQPVTDC